MLRIESRPSLYPLPLANSRGRGRGHRIVGGNWQATIVPPLHAEEWSGRVRAITLEVAGLGPEPKEESFLSLPSFLPP